MGQAEPGPSRIARQVVLTGLLAFLAIFWQWRQAEALARSVTAANVQLREQRSKAVDAQTRAEQASKAERWERYRSNRGGRDGFATREQRHGSAGS